MPRSEPHDPMNTAALLKEMYGPRPVIPLEIVCRDYFSHLTPEKLLRKVSAGEIALPLLRIEDSVRCQKGVFLKDLAGYLDRHDGQRPWEDVYKERAPTGFVYVLGFDNWVKIGYTSKSVEKRMYALQTSIPIKLELILTIPGSKQLEARLHLRFSEYRRQGEWFSREGEPAEWIASGCKEAGG